MRDLSKNVAQSVGDLVKSCEALKGMTSTTSHYILVKTEGSSHYFC